MGSMRKYKKAIQKSGLRFDLDMYNNVLGSLVITHAILNGNITDRSQVLKIKSTWKKLKKRGLDYWIDDKEFIQKALKEFDMEPSYGNFAMVQGDYNVLFAPFVEGVLYPIREDGYFARTLRDGKVYPIVESVSTPTDSTTNIEGDKQDDNMEFNNRQSEISTGA